MTTSSPKTPGRVVIIPCGGKKLDHAAPAGEMYVGSYHRACRRAADALIAAAGGGTILILSAKYGLLPLDQVIEPYDVRMGDDDSVLPSELTGQAYTMGLLYADDVIVLGGKKYTNAAQGVWPEAQTPLAGTTGIGHQLSRLARIATGDGVIRPHADPAETPAGRPAKPGGPKPGRSVRVGVAWDDAEAKARRAGYPFADALDELLTAWVDGRVAITPDLYPFTVADVADSLGAPLADIMALVDGIADAQHLYDPETQRVSQTGRGVLADSWTPEWVTVEIGVLDDGVTYRPVGPAESYNTVEAQWYTGMPALAQDMADRLAGDPHSPVYGARFQLRMWAGKDADTSTAPAARVTGSPVPRPPAQLPGCGGMPAVRIEGYRAKGGMAHGSLDVTAYGCPAHSGDVVAALREAGFTTFRQNTDSTLPCGYWVDFTGPEAVYHDPAVAS